MNATRWLPVASNLVCRKGPTGRFFSLTSSLASLDPASHISVESIESSKKVPLTGPQPVSGLSIPKNKEELIAHIYDMARRHIPEIEALQGSEQWLDYALLNLSVKFRLTRECSQTFLGFPISAADLTNIVTLADLINYVDLYTLQPVSKRWFAVNNPFQPADKVELFFKESQASLPPNLHHVTLDDPAETVAQRDHLHAIKYWKYYGKWRLEALKDLKIKFRKSRGKEMQRVFIKEPLWKRGGEP